MKHNFRNMFGEYRGSSMSRDKMKKYHAFEKHHSSLHISVVPKGLGNVRGIQLSMF